MPKLSVVIPIYKVEAYLARCVNSVLNQTFSDLEVILVDDGSPDNCPAICDEFAAADTRVKVIHKPNGGLSSARNEGLKIATGEYVAFLDSDDAWAQNGLTTVMDAAKTNNADMVLFMSVDVTENGNVYKRRDTADIFCRQSVITLPIAEYYSALVANGDLQESACTKLFKTEFLKSNNLYFEYGIIGEDTEWMFRVLRELKSVTVVNEPLFVCTIGRAGSISNSAGEKSLKDTLSTINACVEYNSKSDSPVKDFELAHCAYLYSVALGIYGGLNKETRKAHYGNLQNLAFLLNKNASRKTALVNRVYKLFGVNGCAFVLKTYMKLNKSLMLGRKKTDGQ